MALQQNIESFLGHFRRQLEVAAGLSSGALVGDAHWELRVAMHRKILYCVMLDCLAGVRYHGHANDDTWRLLYPVGIFHRLVEEALESLGRWFTANGVDLYDAVLDSLAYNLEAAMRYRELRALSSYRIPALFLVGILLLMGCGRGWAQPFEPTEASTGVLSIDATDGADWFISPHPDYLVLEYYVVGSATEDTYPDLQLFGDGRVQVHRSSYRTSPGDFTMQLSGAEVDGLLQSLVMHGVLEFDRAAIEGQVKREHDQLVARTGKYPFATDGEVVSIEINLELYIPAGTKEPIENFHHRVSWSDVEHTAELYPRVEAIQGLRAAIRELDAIARRAANQPRW